MLLSITGVLRYIKFLEASSSKGSGILKSNGDHVEHESNLAYAGQFPIQVKLMCIRLFPMHVFEHFLFQAEIIS
jgi:hypothetical protein